MKLRNIVFLFSIAVVLPQMSYGGEESEQIPVIDTKEQLKAFQSALAEKKTQLEMLQAQLTAKDLDLTTLSELKYEQAVIDEKIVPEDRYRLMFFPPKEEFPDDLALVEKKMRRWREIDMLIRSFNKDIEIERDNLVDGMQKLQDEIKNVEATIVLLVGEETPRSGVLSVVSSAEEGPPPEEESGWFPELSKKDKQAAIGYAMFAAIAGAGYLWINAPQWMKNIVKKTLHEHGKKLSDTTPAEQDLLMAATYARFNPLASFRFKRAAARMPLDTEFSKELWPVLYQVYYGPKKTTRKQRRELKKMYDDAREKARAAAQKVAHNKRRRKVRRKVV